LGIAVAISRDWDCPVSMEIRRPFRGWTSRLKQSDPIYELLSRAKTIAVVGLSESPLRPSHGVSAYMQAAGYQIIPVNPQIAEALGEKAYASLLEMPLEVREKLCLSAEGAAALQAELAGIAGLREFAVLSTCNRIEFYGVAADREAAARVTAAFCTRQQFDAAEFEKIRLSLRGPEAVQHLVEVAAGLDSQMLGETEIFGQLKKAYELAFQHKHTGARLNKAFQRAFNVAKHIRTETNIQRGSVSVGSVAVELAEKIFSRLSEKTMARS